MFGINNKINSNKINTCQIDVKMQKNKQIHLFLVLIFSCFKIKYIQNKILYKHESIGFFNYLQKYYPSFSSKNNKCSWVLDNEKIKYNIYEENICFYNHFQEKTTICDEMSVLIKMLLNFVLI